MSDVHILAYITRSRLANDDCMGGERTHVDGCSVKAVGEYWEEKGARKATVVLTHARDGDSHRVVTTEAFRRIGF